MNSFGVHLFFLINYIASIKNDIITLYCICWRKRATDGDDRLPWSVSKTFPVCWFSPDTHRQVHSRAFLSHSESWFTFGQLQINVQINHDDKKKQLFDQKLM